jgi:RNA 3'-terminal phosphate cyclase (ATP)
MDEMLQIDGSYGEGGGQVIRTALTLAAMTGREVMLTRIRAGREKPGLQAQHLTAVRLAADLCAARVEGDALGSVTLRFAPQGPVSAGNYIRDIGTAGAMALVLQTVLLPLARSGGRSTVRLTGGSHVSHAPSVDYLAQVYAPALQRMGLPVRLQLSRAGFFPRGGGEAQLEMSPMKSGLRPLDLVERGSLQRVTATITTSSLPPRVAALGAELVARGLGKLSVRRELTVETYDLPSSGPGAAILLAAECEGGLAGFISLGAKGLPMEQVAERACRDYATWWKSGAAVDVHLADQLVLPAALTGQVMQWTTPEVSEHLRTVIWLVEQFLPVTFTITERAQGGHLVQVEPR